MLRTRFQEEVKKAMHARDAVRTGTLRLIIAAMKDRDIAARAKGNQDGISEEEILSMLQSMIKQRQESIKMYETGKRADLVAREQEEVAVIQTFLPKQLSEQEVQAAIETAVRAVGATGIKDMGKVMAELKVHYAGQIDFASAGGMVKKRLAG